MLLSGGVGLTPMVSILETITEEHPDLEAHFVHGALNRGAHAMDQHVRQLDDAHGKIETSSFYSAPTAEDAVGLSHDFDGFITAEWLRKNTPIENAEFYLCGPKLSFAPSFLRWPGRAFQASGFTSSPLARPTNSLPPEGEEQRHVASSLQSYGRRFGAGRRALPARFSDCRQRESARRPALDLVSP